MVGLLLNIIFGLSMAEGTIHGAVSIPGGLVVALQVVEGTIYDSCKWYGGTNFGGTSHSMTVHNYNHLYTSLN